MPPESFQDWPASAASDVWAIGCIVHQTMKGEVLFRSEVNDENTDEKIAERIMKHVPGRLPKDYSRPTRSCVWLMLLKDPAARPSAKEVLVFLDSRVNKSAAGIALVKPEEGTELGTTTTIHSFRVFGSAMFDTDFKKAEESKALTSSEAVAPKTSQTQSNEDVTEHLRSSETLTVRSSDIYQEC